MEMDQATRDELSREIEGHFHMLFDDVATLCGKVDNLTNKLEELISLTEEESIDS